MAFIRVPDGVRLRVELDIFGKRVVNIHYATTPDIIDAVKLLALATRVRNWYQTYILATQSTEIAIAGVTATNMDVPNGEEARASFTPPVAGALPGLAVSANVAFVVSHLTAKTGRSFRGRTYVPGLRQTDTAQNVVNSARIAALLTGYAALITELNAENATLVVASFQSGGLPRAEAVTTPINGVVAGDRLDTQRRRLTAET